MKKHNKFENFYGVAYPLFDVNAVNGYYINDFFEKSFDFENHNDAEELEYNESRPIKEEYNEAELFRFLRSFGLDPEIYDESLDYAAQLVAVKATYEFNQGFYKPSTRQFSAILGVLSTTTGELKQVFKNLLDAAELA